MVLYEKHLLRLLVIAAITDWLVSRTLARVAIFIPKSPVLIGVHQVITFIGQYASTLSALLALFGIVWIAWRLRHQHHGIPSILFAGLILFSLAFLLQAPNGFLQLVPLILALGIVVWLGWRLLQSAGSTHQRVILILPAVAVGIGRIYHIIQTAYSIFRLPGPPAYAQLLFNLGESLVVITPFCLWWIYQNRDKDKKIIGAYAWGLVSAILFMAFRLANPAMAGILAIWSTGLTLYLPAPVYALGLGFGIATVVLSRARDDSAGSALLLLACAGYAPQLSSQIFFSLIALSLLAGEWKSPAAATISRSFSAHENDALLLGSERGRV